VSYKASSPLCYDPKIATIDACFKHFVFAVMASPSYHSELNSSIIFSRKPFQVTHSKEPSIYHLTVLFPSKLFSLSKFILTTQLIYLSSVPPNKNINGVRKIIIIHYCFL
jgi:hypothetical protein